MCASALSIPRKAAGAETVSTADRIARNVPIGFVYLLWMSIFTVMQMLLNNTIEEKSNRIVEVLLSSVTPNEIMMGKLLGIAGSASRWSARGSGPSSSAAHLYQGARRRGHRAGGRRRGRIGPHSDVPAVLPARLPDLRRAVPVDRRALQRPQGGPELPGPADADHDGPASSRWSSSTATRMARSRPS